MLKIAIAGGKGGIGKTAIAMNLAYALNKLPNFRNVYLMDADQGTANIKIALNLEHRASVEAAFTSNNSILELAEKGPYGLNYILGQNGDPALLNLPTTTIYSKIADLKSENDVMVIDSSAGLSANNLQFIASCDVPVIVTTPEPTAIADSYAMIKLLALHHNCSNFLLLVNKMTNLEEFSQIYTKINNVASNNLSITLLPLGGIMASSMYTESLYKHEIAIANKANFMGLKNFISIANKVCKFVEYYNFCIKDRCD